MLAVTLERPAQVGRRNGEPDVLPDRGDRRVHADHVPVQVQQRPAGVALVDRRVGLDDAVEFFHRAADRAGHDVAAEARHDAGAHGVAEFRERVADRDGRLPELRLPVRQSEVREIRSFDLQQRDVGRGMPGDDRRLERAPVVEDDGVLRVFVAHDVPVREQETVATHEERGAAADLPQLCSALAVSRDAQRPRRTERDFFVISLHHRQVPRNNDAHDGVFHGVHRRDHGRFLLDNRRRDRIRREGSRCGRSRYAHDRSERVERRGGQERRNDGDERDDGDLRAVHDDFSLYSTDANFQAGHMRSS